MSRRKPPIQAAPIAAGIALICCGALITRLQPHLLALPAPVETKRGALERFKSGDRLQAAAQKGRDTIIDLMPHDMLSWLGRMLMLAGAAVVVTRLLDLLADDDRTR